MLVRNNSLHSASELKFKQNKAKRQSVEHGGYSKYGKLPKYSQRFFARHFFRWIYLNITYTKVILLHRGYSNNGNINAYIQNVPGGKVNILGGGSVDYSE